MTDTWTKKILVLGAPYTVGNRGVGALAFGTLNALVSNYPNAKISFLEYSSTRRPVSFSDSKFTKNIGYINLRFSKKFWLRNNITTLLVGALIIKVLPLSFIRKIVFRFLPHLYEINGYDVGFAINGGDSFSDIYGIPRLIYFGFPQVLLILLRKRVILLPQTLGPFSEKLSRTIAKFIMLRAESIYARDNTSAMYIKDLFKSPVIDNKIGFSYDVGFLLKAEEPSDALFKSFQKIRSSRPLVGLNISGLLFHGGYSQDDQFELGLNYPDFIRELAIQLMHELDVDLLLVPHVFGTGFESDFTVCNEVFQELTHRFPKNLFFIDQDYGPDEIKFIIGKTEFFIGSRMHACIAALSQHIPAVAIAYSKKFHGVYQTLGLESLVADPQKMNPDQVKTHISDAFHKRTVLSNNLKERIPEVKASILQKFADIL